MYKLIAVLSVAAAAGLVTLKVTEDSRQQTMVSAEVTDFSDETMAMIIKYRCFKDTLESALQALAQGKISLPEATVRVQYAANGFCPIYLDRIRVAEKGATPQERIARNLVGHIRSQEEANRSLKRRAGTPSRGGKSCA